MSKRKTKKTTLDGCELMDLDLNQFFVDAVRERGLYALLDSLNLACRSRAERFRVDLETEQHGAVRPLMEDEAEFFEDAAEDVLMASSMLKHNWPKNAPMSADGDFRRHQERMREVARDYFRGLLATLNDPAASIEERAQVRAVLTRESEGTMWFDRGTGKPDFEMANLFRQVMSAINDPETSDQEKSALSAKFAEMVNR
jgi:hypothetical protein